MFPFKLYENINYFLLLRVGEVIVWVEYIHFSSNLVDFLIVAEKYRCGTVSATVGRFLTVWCVTTGKIALITRTKNSVGHAASIIV